ncbi:MAG: polysaccharide deacetylase family protein [Promethearchaeota archaeon]
MHDVFLTFDTEDFISKNSVQILRSILEGLRKYDLKAIFFITGHMAEKLEDFDEVVELLSEHEIGYHSSSHSVHPTIFEYTDLADYNEAFRISLERETAHINPLTGEIEGKGGIFSLRTLFHKKQIRLFRSAAKATAGSPAPPESNS